MNRHERRKAAATRDPDDEQNEANVLAEDIRFLINRKVPERGLNAQIVAHALAVSVANFFNQIGADDDAIGEWERHLEKCLAVMRTPVLPENTPIQ